MKQSNPTGFLACTSHSHKLVDNWHKIFSLIASDWYGEASLDALRFKPHSAEVQWVGEDDDQTSLVMQWETREIDKHESRGKEQVVG